MLKKVSTIGAGIINKVGKFIANKTTPPQSNKSANINSRKSEDSSVELDSNFDDTIPKEYEYGSWNKTKRHVGNGEFDADSIQGNMGDCGLLSTLRALSNSENGQKKLGEVMSYDSGKGEWSFKFKTKDFTEGGKPDCCYKS